MPYDSLEKPNSKSQTIELEVGDRDWSNNQLEMVLGSPGKGSGGAATIGAMAGAGPLPTGGTAAVAMAVSSVRSFQRQDYEWTRLSARRELISLSLQGL
jgi:hypothetical protein